MEKYTILDDQDFIEVKEYLNSCEYKVVGEEIHTDEYKIIFDEKYKDFINNLKSSKYKNDLIYGKDKTLELISIEADDKEITLFKNDGTFEKRSNLLWIVSQSPINNHSIKLLGNLGNNYITYFKSLSAFFNVTRTIDRSKCYINFNNKESFLMINGMTLFKGLQVEDVSVLSFDIETSGFVKDETSTVFLITNTFKKDKKIYRKQFRLDHYANSGEMIEEWCNWVRRIDPTVITGHNIIGYDFPYLIHVANLYNKTIKIGKLNRDVSVKKDPSEYRVDGTQTWQFHPIHIYGRHVIDTMFLSVKYDIGRNFPSWGLKPIINWFYEQLKDKTNLNEVEQNMVDQQKHRQFYDAAKIKDNWQDPVEREKIVQYGIHDGDDSLFLYETMIPSYFYITQSVSKTFQHLMESASGSWLNSMLIRSYLQINHSLPKVSLQNKVSGGISHGIPGVYKNVFKIDVKSMYPSIIRAFKLYPKSKDPFKHYLEITNIFTEQRFYNKDMYKKTKDKYYEDMQASQKILINSLYGLMGTPNVLFNDFELADKITGIGRQILKKTVKWSTGRELESWWNEYETEKDDLYKEILDDNA